MRFVFVLLLILSINGLVLFAVVNLGLSFWRRWVGGTPAATAAADTLLARPRRQPSS